MLDRRAAACFHRGGAGELDVHTNRQSRLISCDLYRFEHQKEDASSTPLCLPAYFIDGKHEIATAQSLGKVRRSQ
jgi:hypothetical protein